MKKILAATTALTLLAGAALAQDKTKACFVYVGPITDGGWTQAHHAAVLKTQAHFGESVEVFWQESVPEGADSERVMTQMALSGCKIIFTTSFGYMDPTNNVAAKFPDVKFEHATGYKREHPNVTTYNARFYEGRAVMGTIAGRMTKTNKIGYIASYPIPEVIQGINASYIHAKRVNPDVTMAVVWAFAWNDPAKEADSAKALIEQGVDVIFQHTDTTAPLALAAQTPGVIGFGQARDMEEYKPSPRVSSIIDNWDAYYIKRIQAVIDGTWTSQDSWDGIASGAVGIGEITGVPEEVKAEAGALAAAIVAGTYHPFTGPLNKQDGTVWMADGQVPTDGDFAGMDFYVEGITGEIPK